MFYSTLLSDQTGKNLLLIARWMNFHMAKFFLASTKIEIDLPADQYNNEEEDERNSPGNFIKCTAEINKKWKSRNC